MATKEDIKQALYDELTAIISSETSVSTPDDHVNTLRERGVDARYPFLGFEVFGSPRNRGFGDNVHVDETVYVNGLFDHVVYRRDTNLTVHFGALAEDPHVKDQLYTAVADTFDTYRGRRRPEDFHSDVERISGGGFSDVGDPDVHGDRLEYTMVYGRYFNVDEVVPIRDIEWTIEDLDEDVVYHSDTITA